MNSCTSPIGVILPPGVYRGDSLAADAAPPAAEEAAAATEKPRCASTSTHRERGVVAPPTPQSPIRETDAFLHESEGRLCACRHSQAEETCYAIRAAAAERALHALQLENDALKRGEVALLAREQEKTACIAALREELRAMGQTVSRQTATLGALTGAMERQAPHRLVKAAHTRHEEVVQERKDSTPPPNFGSATGATNSASPQASPPATAMPPAPETIHKEDNNEEGGEDHSLSARAAVPDMQSQSVALNELYRTLTALDRFCDAIESERGGKEDASNTPIETLSDGPIPLSKVTLFIVSCVDVPVGMTASAHPIRVAVRGPFSASYARVSNGENAVVPTLLELPLMATTDSGASADGTYTLLTPTDSEHGTSFRCLQTTAWHLRFDILLGDGESGVGPSSDTTVASATLPVRALLTSSLRRTNRSVASSSSFHTVPLHARGKACGAICIEVSVTPCVQLQQRSAAKSSEGTNAAANSVKADSPKEQENILTSAEVQLPTAPEALAQE